MERAPCAAALLGLGFSFLGCLGCLGCAVGAPGGSEFGAAAEGPAARAESDAPAAKADEAQRIRASAPAFNSTTPIASLPVECPTDEEPFAGCAITHDIRENTLGADVSMTCGSDTQASNGCSTKPLSFEFVDEWANHPKKLTIAFDTAYFCAAGGGLLQVVELNGQPVGTFEGNRGDCTCDATSKERVIEVPGASLGMLKPGLMNRISIVGPNRCIALRPRAGWRGAYARVTTAY